MRDFRIFRTVQYDLNNAFIVVQHIGIHMSIVFQRNEEHTVCNSIEFTVCKVQSRRILQESRSFIKC